MSNSISGEQDASWDTEPAGAADRWLARGPLWVVIVAVLCFGNGLNGTFVLDDAPNILENQSIRNLWSLDPWNPPADAYSLAGRPFGNFMFAVDYALFGLNVRGYHAGNLLCHILAGCALLGCLRLTFTLPTIPARVRGNANLLALAITLIWVAHPLQTAAVTYISQRLESLASLWSLLALYCFLAGSVRAQPVGVQPVGVQPVGVQPSGCFRSAWQCAWHHRWHVLAVIACLLGVLTKEITVTAPILILLYDRLLMPDGKASIRRHWKTHLVLFATWIPLACLIISSQGRSGTVALTGAITPWNYFLSQLGYIVTYLKLCFWPAPLIFDYGWEVAGSWSAVAGSAAIVAALLAATAWSLRRHPGFGYLGVSFFALLAPTSTFVPILTQTAAEHRMYLPSAVVIAATVLALFAAWPRVLQMAPALDRPAWGYPGLFFPLLAMAAVLLSLTVVTMRRNLDYRSAEVLWRDTVAKRPNNPRARMALANLCQSSGNCDEAIALCHEAIRIAPDFLNVRVCLLRSYFAANRESDAWHDEALRPVFFSLFLTEARRLSGEGRDAEALRQLDRALELKFKVEEVQELRATILGKTNREPPRNREARARVISP